MKFVTKYPVDGLPALSANGEANWEARNRVKRSVNGFIMETYCEVLGRRCTQQEMQGHLDWWPDPQQSQELGGGSAVVGDVQITAGKQKRLDLLHKASMTPGTAPPENGQPEDDMPMSGGIPDPDYYYRLRLRKSIMLSNAYIRRNLQRMIDNVLHIGGQPVTPSTSEIDQFFQRYKAAMFADLAPLMGVDPDTGEPIKLNGERNHRAEFGRELYRELCGRYHIRPIEHNSFGHKERIVFASFFSWYINYAPLPGTGPFDVWAPHPHTTPTSLDWVSWLGAEGNPWGAELPGSTHGVWRMNRQQSKEFLRQNFTDAVDAGVDVLIFDTWIRPGATVYPWMPEGGCQNWWECQGGDAGGLNFLKLAVEVLNEMKRQGLSTPKLAFGLETPQFGPVFDAGDRLLKQNMDPVHWAACAMFFSTGDESGYSADWPYDRDPKETWDERDSFCWPFKFPEAQRYLASMARTVFQEVPLEHLAFIKRRPIINIWYASDNIKPAKTHDSSPEARIVSRLFSEEFYGLHLWVQADEQWSRGDTEPEQNDFVYREPVDPSDDASDPIRVGDATMWKAGSEGVTMGKYLTTFSIGPGSDGTTKTWAPARGGNTTEDTAIKERDFGRFYFNNWSRVVSMGFFGSDPYPSDSSVRASRAFQAQNYLAELSKGGGLRAGQVGQDSWMMNVKRVLIETWNELYEGTGVCRSREYDDAYMDITRFFSDIWRDGQLPRDPEVIMRTGYKAITGMDLPPDIGPPYPGTIEGMANLVFQRPEARFRHPPRITAHPTPTSWRVAALIAPAPCVRWYLRTHEPVKFFPVTVAIEGTGKTRGHAFLWMKFFPFNHEVKDPFEDHQDPPYDQSYQRWRVFTGSWGQYLAKGGAVTHCVLVEVWQHAGTDTLYGCMQPFDPGWPYYRMGHWHTPDEDPPPLFLGWNEVNWMSRPWDVVRDNHPNVCRVQMPDAGTTGVFVLNVVVNPFYGQQSCVVLMGGSYLESGEPNSNGSWVHLERTMRKLDLRWEGDDRNVFDRPKEFDPEALPGGRIILRPILETVNPQLVR